MRRPIALAAVLTLAALPAHAHDAFGNLAPFYAYLLHPLADAVQGITLAAAAVLLASQPAASVRPGYAALAVAGILGLALASTGLGPPPAWTGAALACAFGLAALAGLRLGPAATSAASALAGVLAGLAVALPDTLRPAGMAALGAVAGITLAPLLLWGVVDTARARLGPVACAVAGSWVAAIGIMMVALAAA